MSDIIYFAYGSNMLTERLAARCGNISCLGRATLAGYRLSFDMASPDGSAKGAFLPAADDAELPGVIWQMPSSELSALDRAEGRGVGYERWWTRVTADDGEGHDVLTYWAIDRHADLRPYAWYLALVLAGAIEHGLPAAHVARIRQQPFVLDERAQPQGRAAGLDALEQAGLGHLLAQLQTQPVSG